MQTLDRAQARTARHTLPASLASVPDARELVVAFAADCQASADTLDAIALCVSEMVSNAIRHARSAPTLELSYDGTDIHVGVTDQDPHVPVPRTPDLTSPGGRGLGIMQAYAARTWIVPFTTGKTVWCTFRA